MQKTIIAVNIILLFAGVALALSGCQGQATPNAALGWQVQVTKSEIKAGLQSVEAVTQYNGSKLDVTHTQNPTAGDVYLIIAVTIRKTDAASTAAFDWQALAVRDASGNSYPRLANDTFLEQFQYTPRITGLTLRLGEYRGWMAVELPAGAAQGKLALEYTAEGSRQEIVLQK